MSVGQAGNHSSPPRVVIDEMVYQKIMHWVNKSQYEVSGLGKVIVAEGEIRVVDAYLLPQKNTSVTTDIEAADVGKLMYDTREIPGELRFWWHSHVNMNVFWSGTDLATIKVLAQGGWFVNTVFNKRWETKTAICMNDPFPLMFDDIKLVVERALPAELVAEWDKDYQEKVTNVAPKLTAVGKGTGHHPSKYPPLTKQQKARLDSILPDLPTMELGEDENDRLPFWLQEPDDDGVFSDLDSPYGRSSQHSRRKGELEKGEVTVQSVLDKRDRLENRLNKLEDKFLARKNQDKSIPTKLVEAIANAQCDLDEVEEELDQMQMAGLISEEIRMRNRGYGAEEA